MKKNILVTGGAGYIGSKICLDLCDKGHNVFIVDNLVTGYKKLIDKRAKFFKANILETKKIRKIIQENNIQTVYHLAASLSVEESMINPKKYYINNVEGTRSLVNASQGLVKYFIFSSTCAIYNPDKLKIVNENCEISPISHYGKTKHLSELLIKDNKNLFKYSILRYFNVAGSDKKLRQGCISKNGQLIKNLVLNVFKKNFSINVFGNDYHTHDGTCVRDYIHVEDLSAIHIRCLDFLEKNNRSVILNCGYGIGFSVIDVIKETEKIINKKIKIKFKKKRKGDIEKIISNTNKLNKTLKIKFKKNRLKDIIKTSLMWERKNANK